MTITQRRRSLYGKIEIAKKQLGLDDETYRTILREKFGATSRTTLRERELVDLIEHFKDRGFKPRRKPMRAGNRALAGGAPQGKIRALWLDLYHLGLVRNPSEDALTQFVKRQTGADALQFLTGASAGRVIEALKDWAARDAGVSWAGYRTIDGAGFTVHKPKGRVMEAQWRILHDLGEVRIRSTDALSAWVERYLRLPGKRSHRDISQQQADRVIEHLGAWVRRARANGEVPNEQA
ncbi:MAG: gp16 family protein [Sphingomonadales bacterium]